MGIVSSEWVMASAVSCVCRDECLFMLKIATQLTQFAFKIPDPVTQDVGNSMLNLVMTMSQTYNMTVKGYLRLLFIRQYGYRPSDTDPAFLLLRATYGF